MNSHQPFPIADVDIGMYLAKEPWLSPGNAFKQVDDAYVFRGRIHRRNGFERFSSCGVTASSTLTKSAVGQAYEYTLDTDTARWAPESITLTWNDPVNGVINANVLKESFGYQTFNSANAYGWSVVESSTTNQIGIVLQPYVTIYGNQAGKVIMLWDLHSQYTGSDASFGTISWEEDPELPIVGLTAYKSTDGTEFLVAMNTTRFFLYNVTKGYFQDSTGSDQFTGTATDLFWTWPLEDDLIVTNGIDRVKKYTGATDTLVNMGTTIGGGPAIINTAQMVVFFRNHVIYLNTVENSATKPRRARWSRAGAYETLDSEDFADAPSELGAAITAEFVADRLLVGFQKGWMELLYTGDARDLFRWEKTTSIFGATARNGAIGDGARVLSRTENGIEAIDPNEQYPADIAIPDFVIDKLDTLNAGVTYGIRNIPHKQFWWTVVSSAASTTNADRILVGQYQEDESLRWSIFKIPFNVFAEFRSESGANWDDISTNWDDYDVTWDSASGLSGFPVALAGHSNGVVYKFGSDKDHLDDRPFNTVSVVDYQSVGPQSIPLEILSERLSPFPGMNSHLGWVDFYVEASSDVTLTVEFRGNSRLSSYKTASLSLNPSGANEKLYRRVKVGKTATFHSITVKASDGGAFAIDAIIPWFRPAGRMKGFG